MDFLIFFAALGGFSTAILLLWAFQKVWLWLKAENKRKTFMQYCMEIIKEEF